MKMATQIICFIWLCFIGLSLIAEQALLIENSELYYYLLVDLVGLSIAVLIYWLYKLVESSHFSYSKQR